jgi:hypothetical protein
MRYSREITKLLLAITDAADQAGDGDAPGGYETLLAGRYRARDVFRVSRRGAELAGHWQDALNRYAARYGIPRA